MDDVRRLVFLRKEVSQLHRNLLNEETKSFAQNYQNMKYETVEFPKAKMDKNLGEMSKILENQQNSKNIFAKNTSDTSDIAKRISITKKLIEKMD